MFHRCPSSFFACSSFFLGYFLVPRRAGIRIFGIVYVDVVTEFWNVDFFVEGLADFLSLQKRGVLFAGPLWGVLGVGGSMFFVGRGSE